MFVIFLFCVEVAQPKCTASTVSYNSAKIKGIIIIMLNEISYVFNLAWHMHVNLAALLARNASFSFRTNCTQTLLHNIFTVHFCKMVVQK